MSNINLNHFELPELYELCRSFEIEVSESDTRKQICSKLTYILENTPLGQHVLEELIRDEEKEEEEEENKDDYESEIDYDEYYSDDDDDDDDDDDQEYSDEEYYYEDSNEMSGNSD